MHIRENDSIENMLSTNDTGKQQNITWSKISSFPQWCSFYSCYKGFFNFFQKLNKKTRLSLILLHLVLGWLRFNGAFNRT